jgi:hypothetical protein
VGAERYYDLTAAVREKLDAVGEREAAAELLWAERGASTSGEVISNVYVVLRRLDESGVLARAGARDQANEIQELGRRAWDASNRGDLAS